MKQDDMSIENYYIHVNNLFEKADEFDVTPTEEVMNSLRSKKDDTHN